jgi:glucan phosphoethanolaminetransferase (alkaline phosphatase superfamily)
MRAVFGLVGLVVVLAIVGLLAKKQLSATRAPVPALQSVTGAAEPASTPPATVREQSQQVQQQVKQQMEGLMQQARPMPEDAAK